MVKFGKSERSEIDPSKVSVVRLVKSAKGERSDIAPPRVSVVKLVKFAKREISDVGERLSVVRSVRFAKDERSDIDLVRVRCARLVKFAKGERSDIEPKRVRCVRLIKFAKGERPRIEPDERRRSSVVRLVALSSPVKSLIPLPRTAASSVRVAISLVKNVSFSSLTSASAMAARRVRSGIFTADCPTLKSASSPNGTTDAVTRFGSPSEPNVSSLCALPCASVVVLVTPRAPPPDTMANVTGTPSNGRLSLPLTSTISSELSDAVSSPEIL